jgi:hypothetical protein
MALRERKRERNAAVTFTACAPLLLLGLMILLPLLLLLLCIIAAQVKSSSGQYSCVACGAGTYCNDLAGCEGVCKECPNGGDCGGTGENCSI